jgi:hypothetical protein
MPEAHCKRCGATVDVGPSAARSAREPFSPSGHAKAKWQESEWWALAKELVLYVPSPVNPIAFYGRASLYVLFLIWGWQFIGMPYDTLVDGYPPISGSFMHLVNLVFHEAGHVIFMPLGRFMHVLGGTLGQWLIPLIVMCAFLLKTRDTFAASIGLWWLGQSFLDIAPYIYDARAGQLMLLGGVTGRDVPGYHDWETILRDLGWLEYDHAIAGLVHATGAAMMLLSFLWGAYVLLLQYRNLDRRF